MFRTSVVKLLAAWRASTVVPNLCAILQRLSPNSTTYSRGEGVCGGAALVTLGIFNT